MSWKKNFRTARSVAAPGQFRDSFQFQNYGGLLPEVYLGHPNRVERYNQMQNMDLDSEVAAALDILSEFCTLSNPENSTPFRVEYHERPTETELEIVQRQLRDWCQLNQLQQRMFRIFRNTLKFGDQVFVRDPETRQLLWVDMPNVTKIIVNESEGKKTEQYVLRNVNPNLQSLSVTQVTADTVYHTQPISVGAYGAGAYNMPVNPYATNSRFSLGQAEIAIGAEHVVHLSLGEGLDNNWPFGTSILESVFKVFKQKELLEDAIIIYRVQRAPERRIFKIDVGNMPPHLAMAFVERVKNEVHQRRIPSQNGGSNFMDSTYNPLCLDLHTLIPLLDGRTVALQELIAEFESGKQNWAYSCHPKTGKIVPGVITWAGVTRKNAEVIRVTFDNGQSLICTPDHKIPVFGKGFVEAQQLTDQDSLIAFNTRNHSISAEETNEYQQVWDHEAQNWVWTHQMVGEFFQNQEKHQQCTHLPEFVHAEKPVEHHNHPDDFNNDLRVVKIEKIQSRDVGTISIDGSQRWHDFHTFAIDSGIFVKNSVNEDYYFPQTSDGRGSSVETLAGGTNLGEIDDLRYFTNKLFRGLRIPSSYLPTGADDAERQVSDGRVGTALIQEHRFNQYCQRLQQLIAPTLDQEFKNFLRWRGFNLDENMFSLQLMEPQNFAHYRQTELDTARISSYGQLEAVPYMSKRFLMQRFLGLTDAEIAENSRLWREENTSIQEQMPDDAVSLRDVGVTGTAASDDLGNLDALADASAAEPDSAAAELPPD